MPASPRPIVHKEKWRDSLVKTIPAEVLAAYTAVLGLFASMPPADVHIALRIVVYLICLLAIPLWLLFGQKVRSFWHIFAAVLAFFLWDMTIPGGLWSQWEAYKPFIGSVLLILYTYLVSPWLGNDTK